MFCRMYVEVYQVAVTDLNGKYTTTFFTLALAASGTTTFFTTAVFATTYPSTQKHKPHSILFYPFQYIWSPSLSHPNPKWHRFFNPNYIYIHASSNLLWPRYGCSFIPIFRVPNLPRQTISYAQFNSTHVISVSPFQPKIQLRQSIIPKNQMHSSTTSKISLPCTNLLIYAQSSHPITSYISYHKTHTYSIESKQ